MFCSVRQRKATIETSRGVACPTKAPCLEQLGNRASERCYEEIKRTRRANGVRFIEEPASTVTHCFALKCTPRFYLGRKPFRSYASHARTASRFARPRHIARRSIYARVHRFWAPTDLHRIRRRRTALRASRNRGSIAASEQKRLSYF